MQVLRIEPFLQARVMLLNAVAVLWIIQKKRKVRKQIEKRSTEETVGLETVAGLQCLSVIHAASAYTHAPADARIDEPKPRQTALSHEIERNLTRGEKVIASKIDFETQSLIVIEMARVVSGEVVALVLQFVVERTVCARGLVGQEGIGMCLFYGAF